MVTYWYYRVVYMSICASDVPTKYRAEVRAKLKANGYDDCGN